MANDRVEVKYAATGTNEAAQNVEKVNEAVNETAEAASSAAASLDKASKSAEKLGDTASSTTKDTKDLGTTINDLGTGVSGLSDLISVISPRIGLLFRRFDRASDSIQALGSGTIEWGAALKSTIALLSSPYFIGAAGIAAAIGIGLKQASDAQQDYNRRIQEGIELQKELQAAEQARQADRQKTSGDILRQVESTLASKGLPASEALSAAQSAARAGQSSFVSPDVAINELVRVVTETGQIPEQARLERLIRARQLNVRGLDVSSIGTRQLEGVLASGRLDAPIDARQTSLTNSLTDERSRVSGNQVLDALRSRTNQDRSELLATENANRISTRLPLLEQELNRQQELVDSIRVPRGNEFVAEDRLELRRQAVSDVERLKAERKALETELSKANEVLSGRAEYPEELLPSFTDAGRATPQQVRAQGGTVNYNFYGTAYIGNGGDLGVSPNRVRN